MGDDTLLGEQTVDLGEENEEENGTLLTADAMEVALEQEDFVPLDFEQAGPSNVKTPSSSKTRPSSSKTTPSSSKTKPSSARASNSGKRKVCCAETNFFTFFCEKTSQKQLFPYFQTITREEFFFENSESDDDDDKDDNDEKDDNDASNNCGPGCNCENMSVTDIKNAVTGKTMHMLTCYIRKLFFFGICFYCHEI